MNVSFDIRDLVVRRRGKTLLSVSSLQLPYGCHTAVIGPNGAGKSTLLKALIGQAGSGRVTLFGNSVPPLLKRGKIAWVGQHGRYAMPLTVREYISLGRKAGMLPFQTGIALSQEERILLDYFDLAVLADKRIDALSGGEQQRANIVRALMQKAPVLLLDEPCNHLDIRYQHGLMAYLRRHRSEFSAVMVLHDLNLAAKYADYVVLLNQGCIVASGSPDDVMRPDLLREVYRWPVERVCDDKGMYFRV